VTDFAWLGENKIAYVTTGRPRSVVKAAEQRRAELGYRYPQDFDVFTQLMAPWTLPTGLESPTPLTQIISLKDTTVRAALQAERDAFTAHQLTRSAGTRAMSNEASAEFGAPVTGPAGSQAGLARVRPGSFFSRVIFRHDAEGAIKTCTAKECSGFILRVWWSNDLQKILFYRRAGVDGSSYEFYSWSPATDKIHLITSAPDDDFKDCTKDADDAIVCIRETASTPPHIASLNLTTGSISVLRQLNPEFDHIRLGKVERIEWETPRFPWNEPGGALVGLYPPRAYGYVLYPPDFDPRKKYPLIIDPYYSKGFESSLGFEQAQHVYAANGFVVLKTTFPSPLDPVARLGALLMKKSYAPELHFPHISMYAQSTLKALDLIEGKGFIDATRVGIGGVSHGSFVSLYLLQTSQRIAAATTSSPGWSAFEYYADLDRSRAVTKDFPPDPETNTGRLFYSAMDVANNVGKIHSPVLMNLAAVESYDLIRFIALMRNAEKPTDVYIFPNETHEKWQPVHLRVIMERNLDWFRFWLQGIEDINAGKSDQYARWEVMCRQQVKRNPIRQTACITGAR
jgi:hypothetical protein